MIQKQKPGVKPTMSNREVRDALSDFTRNAHGPITDNRHASGILSASLLAGADNRRDDGTIQSIVGGVVGVGEVTREECAELLRVLKNSHGIQPKDALILLRAVSTGLSSEVLRIFETKDRLDAIANEVELSIERKEEPVSFDKAKYKRLLTIIARVMSCSAEKLDETLVSLQGVTAVAFSIDDKRAKTVLAEIVRTFKDEELKTALDSDINTMLAGRSIRSGLDGTARTHAALRLIEDPNSGWIPYVIIARDLAKNLACELRLYESSPESSHAQAVAPLVVEEKPAVTGMIEDLVRMMESKKAQISEAIKKVSEDHPMRAFLSSTLGYADAILQEAQAVLTKSEPAASPDVAIKGSVEGVNQTLNAGIVPVPVVRDVDDVFPGDREPTQAEVREVAAGLLDLVRVGRIEEATRSGWIGENDGLSGRKPEGHIGENDALGGRRTGLIQLHNLDPSPEQNPSSEQYVKLVAQVSEYVTERRTWYCHKEQGSGSLASGCVPQDVTGGSSAANYAADVEEMTQHSDRIRYVVMPLRLDELQAAVDTKLNFASLQSMFEMVRRVELMQ